MNLRVSVACGVDASTLNMAADRVIHFLFDNVLLLQVLHTAW